MKKLAFTFALLASFAVFAEPLNEPDRGRILSELQASRNQFLDSIAGLSPAQWSYKAGPDRWSIAEVSEHIVAAESYMGGRMTDYVLKSKPDAAKAAARLPMNSKIDEKVLVQLRDRSVKATAPGEITPKGIYKTPQEAVAAFEGAREKTVAYVKDTNEALREHFYQPLPGVELDGVQGFLFLCGHNERHVEQIEEVKQSAGYPKN